MSVSAGLPASGVIQNVISCTRMELLSPHAQAFQFWPFWGKNFATGHLLCLYSIPAWTFLSQLIYTVRGDMVMHRCLVSQYVEEQEQGTLGQSIKLNIKGYPGPSPKWGRSVHVACF
jgi:hypothetical protein